MLYYSRSEEAADRKGMRLLFAAGIDPAAMITFCETLRQEGGDVPASLQYLSTHPSTVERIETLKALAAAQHHAVQGKPLQACDWHDIENGQNRGLEVKLVGC